MTAVTVDADLEPLLTTVFVTADENGRRTLREDHRRGGHHDVRRAGDHRESWAAEYVQLPLLDGGSGLDAVSLLPSRFAKITAGRLVVPARDLPLRFRPAGVEAETYAADRAGADAGLKVSLAPPRLFVGCRMRRSRTQTGRSI
jgi:hypothetical protein